jgi:phosphopantetheine--protein transferase-like protein
VASASGGLAIAAGYDLVYVPAFRRLLRPAFIARAFTTAEVTASQDAFDPVVYFAARWAAKEAAYKAVCDLATRCGCATDGLATFRDYEVVRRLGSRVPALDIRGEPGRLLAELRGDGELSASLSLSDEHEYAGAFVTIVCLAGAAAGEATPAALTTAKAAA